MKTNLQKDLQVALSSKFLTSYGSFENITFYNDSTPIYKTNDPMKSRHSKPVKMPLTLSTFSVQLATSKVVFIIDQFLSPYLSYFWEGYSRQKALISLVEKWNVNFGEKVQTDLIFMGISFRRNHDLPITEHFDFKNIKNNGKPLKVQIKSLKIFLYGVLQKRAPKQI